MSTSPSCRDCGATLISSGALAGNCPRCLLELAVEERQSADILGGRYRLLRALGRGGQGQVWHAFDVKLRMEVALKAVRPDLAEDDRARELLRAEVRSARQVVSANVCRVFDLVADGGDEMVSMEFVDGITLAELLAEQRPLDFNRAGEIAGQLLAGLEAIHAAGLVHRDLKPENVMVTFSKRVVIMDFGIARHLLDLQVGTAAGTPAYMSPEQRAGLPVDARGDVFSAALVLAEMVSPKGAKLRDDPPQISAGAWSPILQQALSPSPADRYASAGMLARALENARREATRGDNSPYPGLHHFTQADARFFFGRELEVESLLRQLRHPRVRALIGPSGAGKSSFLRAGLLPSLPHGWSGVVCTPGYEPFAALARALAPELAGVPDLLSGADGVDTSVRSARRWRRRHDHALVVIDQAEELFTLNSLDVQQDFSRCLGRLVLEADVHVLLAFRDDFLWQCQLFEDLRPVFSDLTPLAPPAGGALRRALVQPALACGYRFDDERLVDDMLGDVAHERGTLPLLAFALARLWDHRDREGGLLTRRSYEAIGGVAGALAQHAEAILETVGVARVPILREILRNLVTADGTRAVRGWDELLSAFPAPQEAEAVLVTLVEARLLTSYDASPDNAGTEGNRRVELIHESLLTSWPRLSSWREHDAEGARLRDQLGQAARSWDERGRPTGLLWSGPAFTEYVVWKARYAGLLTAIERAFGEAMETHDGRRRRRARMATGAAFAAVVVVLAIVTHLWIRSRKSEQQALDQALRTEAQELLALGQLEEERNPTLALAHGIAALERADTPEIRRFALRQLWRGPLAFVASAASTGGDSSLAFSADGDWLADSGTNARLWRRDGSGPFDVSGSFRGNVNAQFASDGRRLVIAGRRPSGTAGVDVLGLPELKLLKRIETPGEALVAVRGDSFITRVPNRAGTELVQRSVITDTAQKLGFLPAMPRRLQLDTSGKGYFVSYPGQSRVLTSTFEAGLPGERLVLNTHTTVRSFWIDAKGEQIASLDEAGEIRVGSLLSRRESRALTGSPVLREERITGVAFDRVRQWIVAAVQGKGLRLWDLRGPPDAEPTALGRGPVTTIGAVFDPTGRWLAAEDLAGVTLWPVGRGGQAVLRVSAGSPRDVAFDPNGKWIAASAGSGGIEIWPSTIGSAPRRHIAADVSQLAISPNGQYLAAGTRSGNILLVSIAGSVVRELHGFDGFVDAVAFDATGMRLAADGPMDGGRRHAVRVFDLQTGDASTFDPGDGKDIVSVAFLPDGNLLISSFGGLRRLDVTTGAFELLLPQPGGAFLGPDGRHLLRLQTTNVQEPIGTAFVYDLRERRSWPLKSHGDQVTLMAWDPSGTRVVTGSRDGIVRVGPVTGEEPHLLMGHQGPIWGVRVDPTGKRVASTSTDGTVRIWPMPEGRPLHTWSHEALLDRLRSVTNVRLVPDRSTGSGYRTMFLPFQGWDREPPAW